MPCKSHKIFRWTTVNKLSCYLDQAIWSYVDKGNYLPVTKEEYAAWDRHFEPSWYDSTFFSLVLETYREKTQTFDTFDNEVADCDLFVSEKSFKPMAFQHPYMICGMSGTVQYLKSLGFESFENLFDETYDLQENFYHRLNTIVSNIEIFDQSRSFDSLTQEKIQHNYNKFYDISDIQNRLYSELVEPLVNWINA
jgi:hypothetical protein